MNKSTALRPVAFAIALAASAGAFAADMPTPRISAAELDPAIGACNDFNGYVNSKWVAANPIPADQTRWGSFIMLREQSLDAQHKIVDAAEAGAAKAKAGSVEQKVGLFYHSGMDEATIEKLGFSPIKPELAAIAKLKDRAELIRWIEAAHARGDEQVFHVGSTADYKNASQQVAATYQGGLGLPTPEYYTSDEFAPMRKAYAEHIAKTLQLIGVSAADAQAKAAKVLAFETRLAKASVPRVEMRKPENQFHFISVAEANKLTPLFDWAAYFKALNIKVTNGFSLSQPGFFVEMDAMLAQVPMQDWQDYLSFHTVDGAAPYLSKAFAEERFDFYGKTLSGQPEQPARWKRVLGEVNNGMGQGLGQLYVKEYFPPASKARMEELVKNLHASLKTRIENLEWMTPETKTKALEKWSTFLPKIGYPDKWRDWSGLKLSGHDYYANVKAARAFNERYDFDKVGKATDRYEWGMTPQTVNAYYSPTTNTINFPAAILQPPFFYANGDDAINYGGIGAVIGHEATHGFDDQGSQFDGSGNNANWWTKADRDSFNARTDKLVAQFNAYTPIASQPEQHVNGRLTLGENIADLGGINTALDALHKADAGKPDPMLDGFTRDQRFFLNFARIWRSSMRDKQAVVLIKSDPHSPESLRAIAAPSNMPAFAKAFSCKAGDAMVRDADKQVIIW
ncbi:MAG TPA: M13 family metallopeptidase [Burkholderiaceae bacterium]|jgi:putative endopeptidase